MLSVVTTECSDYPEGKTSPSTTTSLVSRQALYKLTKLFNQYQLIPKYNLIGVSQLLLNGLGVYGIFYIRIWNKSQIYAYFVKSW